jgi:hypothetical protein
MSHTKVPYPVHAVFCGGTKKPDVVIGWARNRVEAMIKCDNKGFETGEFRVSPDSGPVLLFGEPTYAGRHWRVCVRAINTQTEVR